MNPQLATNLEEKFLKFPLLGFPKIDGVRTWNPEGSMLGRSMEPLANKQITEFYSHPACLGFDAELCAGGTTNDDACRKTTSLVNSVNGTLENSQLHIFDWITRETFFLPLQERLRKLDSFVHGVIAPVAPELYDRLQIIQPVVIHTLEELYKFDEHIVGLGYEGTVFRDPKGIFSSGRSSAKSLNYLRLKHFEDREGTIIDILEGTINNNPQTFGADGYAKRSTHAHNMIPSGSVGSLVVQDAVNGKIVTVSKGKLSRAECISFLKHPDLIKGRICTYRIFPKGSLNLPRHPTFRNFRSPQDFDRSGA